METATPSIFDHFRSFPPPVEYGNDLMSFQGLVKVIFIGVSEDRLNIDDVDFKNLIPAASQMHFQICTKSPLIIRFPSQKPPNKLHIFEPALYGGRARTRNAGSNQ